MSSVIAKRYVKALTKLLSSNEVSNAGDVLNRVAAAFDIESFKDVILANDISKEKKLELILSVAGKVDDKLENFFKLLIDNKRVTDIPDIATELRHKISLDSNSFEGIVYSNHEINSKKLSQLEQNISKKLGSTIKLHNEVSGYPGVKVVIDEIGVEMNFSSTRLKSDLKEHIVKAL
jgi:F-type H+-transporting ATPase subunit delta